MALAELLRDDFLQKLGPTYAAAYPHNLEKQFPHVLDKIVSLWGSLEMEPYFENLLITKRPDREGFPTEVADELLRLFAIYHKLGLAQGDSQKIGDIWNWVGSVGYFEKAKAAST